MTAPVTLATLDLEPMDVTTGAFDIITAIVDLALNELTGSSSGHVALYGVVELLKTARAKHNDFHTDLLHAVRISSEAAA